MKTVVAFSAGGVTAIVGAWLFILWLAQSEGETPRQKERRKNKELARLNRDIETLTLQKYLNEHFPGAVDKR